MASIAELKRQKAQLKAKMKEMVDGDTPENPMSDEDQKTFADLASQVEDHEKRIVRMEQAYGDADSVPVEMDMDEDLGADPKSYRSTSKGYTPSVLIKTARPKNERKGIKAARFIVGAGIAQKFGKSAGATFVRDHFEDREVAKTVYALAEGAQSLGGALVPQDFRAELIELLYSQALVRKSGALVYPAPNGNLTLPRIYGATAASWVGENTDIAASNALFDDIQFTAKRLAAVVPVSNSLIRYSPMAVDSIVLDNMIEQLALAEDIAFLTGSVSSTQPGGLIYYTPSGNVITPVSISGLTGAALVQALAQTLEAIKGGLEYNNVPLDGAVWYSHPTVFNYLEAVTDGVGGFPFREDLRKGELLGFKVFKTNNLPTNLGSSGAQGAYLILAQPRQMVIAESLDLITDVSDVASYSLGGTQTSAFSRDQTVFRLIEAVDFNVKHPDAVAYAIVPWATASFTPAGGIQYSTQTANTSDSSAQSAAPTG